MSDSLDRYRCLDTEELAAAFRELGGVQRAVEAERLQILAVLDEREAWRADGVLDAGQWVSMVDALPVPEGRTYARVADRLAELPAVRRVATEGRLSFAQLRAVVELAEESTDELWASDAPGLSPAALAQLVRQRRRPSTEEARRQRQRASWRWWKDRHGQGTRFAGLLPDDAAAIVVGEIEARVAAMGPDEHGVYAPHTSRCADAVVEVFSGAAGDAGRPEIVVHVPVGIDRAPSLPDGTPLSLETVRRLACDSTAWLLVENPDGTVAGYGRRRRLVPDKMRARIRVRDGDTCRFLCCDRRRGLRAHHIAEWRRDGGTTEEDNCVLLCPVHHALVHEGGWTITGNPRDGTLRFHRPGWGSALPAEPAAADPDLLRRLGVATAA
jgi:hypothetical protein